VANYRVLGHRPEPLALLDSPFVGRASELEYLKRAFAQVEQQHRGSCVAVIGEAGVGKSRLVREFRAQVPQSIRQVIVRCASFETQTPYALLANLVRRVCEIDPTSDAATTRATLIRFFGNLEQPIDAPQLELVMHLLGHRGNFPYRPETRRPILARLMRTLFQQLTDRRPLLLVAEDLHWADAASLAILGELAPDLSEGTCLFLVTARPEWLPKWTAELLELPTLSASAAATLITNLLGTADLGLVDRVIEQAGGNPLFREEVALSRVQDSGAR
jgi:predicted ATPase